jgi:hypothetical protein
VQYQGYLIAPTPKQLRDTGKLTLDGTSAQVTSLLVDARRRISIAPTPAGCRWVMTFLPAPARPIPGDVHAPSPPAHRIHFLPRRGFAGKFARSASGTRPTGVFGQCSFQIDFSKVDSLEALSGYTYQL